MKLVNQRKADVQAVFQKLLNDRKNNSAPDGFYTYTGFRDWWRLPLVYPYQLQCIDLFDKTSLLIHIPQHPVANPNKSTRTIEQSIISLTTDGKWLLFKQSTSKDGIRFGMLNYISKRSSFYSSEAAMVEAAEQAGFEGPTELFTKKGHLRDPFSKLI